MRYLFLMAAAAWCALGCAQGIPPARLQAHMLASDRWQREYEEERARSEALAGRLAAAEAALERLTLELAETEKERLALNEELARSQVERHMLEDHILHLRTQKRELAEMHEELSDVWYESALSRARRYRPPPAPEAPSEGEVQGASP